MLHKQRPQLHIAHVDAHAINAKLISADLKTLQVKCDPCFSGSTNTNQ